MRVHVRLFAMQRQQVGARQVELELADGSTAAAAWDDLVRSHPVLGASRPFVRFAINGVYSSEDAPLSDGDELAFIPPVSGGAPDPRVIVELVPEPFPDDIVALLTSRLATPADGGVVAFLGITRETPGTPAPGEEAAAAAVAGRPVLELEYEAHETMAEAVLRQIAAEIAERFGVERVAIVHRTGVVPLGAPSIAVVTAAPHRGDAFAAARYAIDEVKARAPIWKAERVEGGLVWVGHPARTGPEPTA